MIAHEFHKFEQHFVTFRSEVCRSAEEAEKRFEKKLTSLEQKLYRLENLQKDHHRQIEQLKLQNIPFDQKTSKVDKAFRLLEKDAKNHEDMV